MKKGYRYWAPPTQRASGDIIPSRESAVLWLWERPQLLAWERPLYWLFECNWHLWGIDAAGCVIIVAATIARDKTLQDPFGGLVDYARGCSHDEWTAQELRVRWRDYLTSQQDDAKRVVPPIVKPGYIRAVEQALDEREAARDPLPTFVALMGSRNSDLEYSEAGLKNRLLLENLVGSTKVRLRVISGTLDFKGLLVRSWSPGARTSIHWERPYKSC